MTIVLLLMQIFSVSAYDVLTTESVSYSDRGGGASCGLLRHRAKERRKVIREAVHLLNVEEKMHLRKAADLNFLLSNQFFFESELSDDETVEVTVSVAGSLDLQKIIESQGLDAVNFAIRGVGIQWSGPIAFFPKSTVWNFDSGTNRLVITYFIYKSDWCSGEDKVEIFWSSFRDEYFWLTDPK